MKSEDKPRYVEECRKLLALLDLEKMVEHPNDLATIANINRLIAIFTNFSSNDGQDLKDFFDRFMLVGRRSTSKGTLRNRAVDVLKFIGQKIEEMDIYIIEPEVTSKVSPTTPLITATTHILPFQRLSSGEFVRLCFWILKRTANYSKVEYYEGMGDKQRDIVAHTSDNKKHYYQCKKYQDISAATLKNELDLLKKHSEEDLDFKPSSIIFIVGCKISPQARDEVNKYGSTLGFDDITVWSEVELDERANATNGVLEEFFGFSKDSIRTVVQEILNSEDNKKGVKYPMDAPVLDLEGLRRSGGSTGQFILITIVNNSQTQKAIDIQWEIRGFDYSFRSAESDQFSLQPNANKEVTYRLDTEKLSQNEIKELSLVMEFKDIHGTMYFTRRELKQVKVPSDDFFELQKGNTFHPAEQIVDMGIKSVSEPYSTGDNQKCDFEVVIGGQSQVVTVGISRTLLSTWGIDSDNEKIRSALAELGSRIVRKMILKEKLEDYMFVTSDFPSDYQNGFEGYKKLRDSL